MPLMRCRNFAGIRTDVVLRVEIYESDALPLAIELPLDDWGDGNAL